VLVLVSVAILVSVLFEGNVEQQAPVYTTAVLGLILAGAFAIVLALIRQCRQCEDGAPLFLRLRLVYMIGTTLVFAYALGDTIWDSPEGFVVVLAFPLGILLLGAISRAWRSTELRVSDLTFVDESSAELWKMMVGKKVHAAPLRTSSRKARREKTEEIKKYYWIDGPIAFLHVNLVDNRSDFLAPLTVSVKKEDENYVVEVHGSVAIANTIAYISELIDPISLFLGLTQQNLVTQSLKYIIWGEGETGLMVYMILLRYWKWTTEEEDVRPNIFLMSA
ncbi:hypothetical protein L6R52_37690, partial [Myxococcota bacterium]|nr:hypothetical protein [Myxococcota bacterium]